MYSTEISIKSRTAAADSSANGYPKYFDKEYLSRKYLKKYLKLLPEFQLLTVDSPQRAIAEAYVQQRFYESYDARVDDYLSNLFVMSNDSSLCAVAGVAEAGSERLFLEQYLDLPVETAVSNCYQADVSRATIVEIGNLASGTRGASLVLFVVLASMLYRAGFKWQVFTATSAVRKSLHSMGFETRAIGAADPTLLPTSDQEKWGRYYDTNPIVVVGCLSTAMQLIEKRKLFYCLQRYYSKSIDGLAASMLNQRH